MAARMWRDASGTAHVEAESIQDAFWGQGVAHATDRALQLLLMRILVQGRLSELVSSSAESLQIDTFFRRMNWQAVSDRESSDLAQFGTECLQRYCAGLNSVLEKKTPWELRLFGYHPAPWRPQDTIAIARLFGYVGLQQTQARIERLFVEMVQAGVDRDKLEELFPGLLGGADWDLLKQVRLGKRIVPPDITWGGPAAPMIASNNWVVSGQRTTSGKPILANDPHLEGNRIPNVWYEIALHCRDRYMLGGSMPGCPGVLVGRTNDVAWGATYAFMDALDSWIERCRDGCYFRAPDRWLPFATRRELVRRKRKEPVELVFHENDHGVLDGDPHCEGYYLATRWAADRSGARSVDRIMHMWNVRRVPEGLDTLGQVETAWNMVLADRHGDIGYQMSGLQPIRRPGVSGFVPLAGWEPENDWRGFVPHDQLPRVLNPEQGYFVTANNDLNGLGTTRPITMCMGSYRADRITQLLAESHAIAPGDIGALQMDLVSLQAEQFMRVLRPLLPDSPQGDILRAWDLRYDADSRGAYLFERFYAALIREVFGTGGLGDFVVIHLAKNTGTLIDFYANFDAVMLASKSHWFGSRSRDAVYRAAARRSLNTTPRRWGEGREYALRHLLLGGKLPRFLGFDRGPVTAIGGRATVHQGQIYRSDNRLTTFVPSYRLVTDMAWDTILTNLLGGPSDRRFSPWYCSGLADWRRGQYKQINGQPAGKRRRFP